MPLLGGGDQRFLHRVLGRREVLMSASDRGEHLRREIAQQVPNGGVVLRVARAHMSGGALMTCRTSIGMTSGVPPGPGADEALAAIS